MFNNGSNSQLNIATTRLHKNPFIYLKYLADQTAK